ncbi:uncharacterized protein [Drosophila bipectinata]|uniref:uncharacterized protein n=1 Tax=Drosophila bipectinata TaxID=42026 RepID=UPI0038B33615
MLGYMGSAKDRLDEIRNLSSDARIKYASCVKPMFEWCISSNGTINFTIPHIKAWILSEPDKEILWQMISNVIDTGLKKATTALDLLGEVQHKTAQLSNAFNATFHNVTNDFAPNGFYGELKTDLQTKIQDIQKQRKISLIATIFGAIGLVLFGGLGVGLGLTIHIIEKYKISSAEMWSQEKAYEKQLEMINYTFKILNEEIEKAKSIVTDIDNALSEDRTNLHELRAKIEAANLAKYALNFTTGDLRNSFVPVLTDLSAQCTKYVNWHGYDKPFYHTNISRRRREAEHTLKAQKLLDESESFASPSQPSDSFISYVYDGSRTVAPEPVTVQDSIRKIGHITRFPIESMSGISGSHSPPLLKT